MPSYPRTGEGYAFTERRLMLSVFGQGIENFCWAHAVERQSYRERDEDSSFLPKRVSMGDDGGRASMGSECFEIGAAEETNHRRSHRAAVTERTVRKDAGVGGTPVNTSSNEFEYPRGARTVAARPSVAICEPASNVILVDAAACDQRFREVERHLGIVGIAPATLRRSADDTPERAFEGAALTRSTDSVTQSQPEQRADERRSSTEKSHER